MNSQLRQQAIDLRLRKELSYSEIRKQLRVSKSTLSYWLRDFPLSEEKILELRRKGWQRGEASRERFRITMRKKREAKNAIILSQQRIKLANLSGDAIFVAGLMLYLGEGDKKNQWRIALANTDSELIKFFIRWLDQFLGIKQNRLKATLHLYENMDLEQEKEFWKKELNFNNSQFFKPQIRKLKKSSFSYKESYRHGTCSIYLGSVNKKTELMMGIEAFLEKYKEMGM